MGLVSAIVGGLGGLCAIFGILIAMEVVTDNIILISVGWVFWLVLSVILLLGSIALSVGKSGGGDYD